MYILVCLSLFHNKTVCILFKLDHIINIIFKLKDEEKNIPGSFRMRFCQFFKLPVGDYCDTAIHLDTFTPRPIYKHDYYVISHRSF